MLEIKDNGRDHVGVVDGAPADIFRNHGPVGIGSEGNGSTFAVIKGGVLSEDEGSISSAVKLDGEDWGGSLEVFGSIATDTQTKISVSGSISEIVIRVTRRCVEPVPVARRGLQSCGLELPSTAVTNHKVAEVEGISSSDLEIG